MDNGQLEDIDLEDAELLRKLEGVPKTVIAVEAKDTPGRNYDFGARPSMPLS